jgi:hypothetical protein
MTRRGGPRGANGWRRRRVSPAAEIGPLLHRAMLRKAHEIRYEILSKGNVSTSLGLLNQSIGEEPLTLQALLDAAEAARGLRPKDSWRVCRQFAPDQITVAATTEETFYFVHPNLFPRVAAKYFAQQTPEQRANPLFGLNAVDLDPVKGDTPGQAAWRGRERRRCLTAFAAVMVKSIEAQQAGGPDGQEG